MRTIKRLFAVMVLAMSSTGAFAGIPVIDVSNLVQALQQVAAWSQQYTQMLGQIQNQVQQIQQLQSNLNSINGIRNLGQVVNNIGYGDVVPVNVLQQLQSLRQWCL